MDLKNILNNFKIKIYIIFYQKHRLHFLYIINFQNNKKKENSKIILYCIIKMNNLCKNKFKNQMLIKKKLYLYVVQKVYIK